MNMHTYKSNRSIRFNFNSSRREKPKLRLSLCKSTKPKQISTSITYVHLQLHYISFVYKNNSTIKATVPSPFFFCFCF
ncbi:hypothetical protein QVD17_04090 [Tagetes erecta]|uniref:Uncharacterized protein n=1 Tax=Tagetes erecta TaxID=13708 RepID=A0AAD8LC65_TARER|nr:hypothetical protein QVD17_04090 [Tagetes erecta]